MQSLASIDPFYVGDFKDLSDIEEGIISSDSEEDAFLSGSKGTLARLHSVAEADKTYDNIIMQLSPQNWQESIPRRQLRTTRTIS